MTQDKTKYFGKRDIDNSLLIQKQQDLHRFNSATQSWKRITRAGCLIVAFGLLFIIAGCSKWLEIKPESELLLDDFWQTESQATSVVAGCYKALTGDACMNRMVLWGEGRSDNVMLYYNNNLDFKKMVTFDLTAANSYCQWGSFYTVINYCNTFLHYAPGVLKVDKNFTEAKLEGLEGEVLTIRSLAYFYLVRAFRRVPWVDQPSIDDKQNFYIGQSSDTVIISNIISDLNLALKYAPSSYPTLEENKGRITKKAVAALLADVYLWDNQYDNCVAMCNQVIAYKNLQLVDTKTMLHDVFYTGNSTESIFELQFGQAKDNHQFNNSINDYYGAYNNLGRLSFSDFLYSGGKITSSLSPFNYTAGSVVESSNDSRLKDFIYPNLSLGTYTIFKYTGYDRTEISSTSSSYSFRNSSVSANWIVYRLADILLMKAEALVELNRSGADLNEALQLVNKTYLRSNTAPGTDSLRMSNYQSKNDLSKLVLRERQRELLFEGKRWFDLMRLARRANTPGPLVSYVSKKFSGGGSSVIGSNSIMDALYLPVSTTDLKSNPKLQQNPYFKTTTDVSSNQGQTVVKL